MTQPLSDLFETPPCERIAASKSKQDRGKRRYLALFLPWLPVERVVAARLERADRPLALIEKERGMLRLSAVCAQASALGLAPGMALADARAQVPDLQSRTHDRKADAALLQRCLARSLAFTPTVEADPPQMLLLDIAGCTHLFGGEAAMRDTAARHIAAATGAHAPLTVQSALADTPDAAAALARFGGNDTHRLPITALPLPEASHVSLRRAGFVRLADLSDLPRAPLAARFGSELLVALDRLLGREDRHVSAPQVQPRLLFERRFAEPIGHESQVLDAIEDLAVEAVDRLAERGQGGRCFAVRLYRSDGHIAELAIETGAPTRDVALIGRLIEERIDSLVDPLDPGFGYDMIRLAVPLAESLANEQQQLHRERASDGAIGALFDRLAVRHGESGLSIFSGGDSHIPERAGLLSGRGAEPLGPAESEAGEPPLRPMLLFDPPQEIEVLAAVPDGPPRRFRWHGKMHRVTAYEGPERLAREWWRRHGGHLSGAEGNAGLTRDYYRIEDDAGHRFWLFRLGLYERETDWPKWYVHGLFA